MNREQFEDYVARFKDTGLTYAMKQRDGSGNVIGMQELTWEEALVHIMRQTQWVILDGKDEVKPETRVLSIVR